MAKRLTEAFKLQEKGVRRKLKKAKWDKSLPSFKNLEIDIYYKEHYEDLELSITNILNLEEKSIKTNISCICEMGSNYLITNIKCPHCGKNIQINRYWNCYICDCPEHEKKIFEISKVSIPEPKKYKELPDGDD